MSQQQDDFRDLDLHILVKRGEVFKGTDGNDHLTGTDFRDKFYIGQGGNDHVEAGGGNDVIYAGATLTGADRIDGGTGNDTLVLRGDYSAGLTLQANTLADVEHLDLQGKFNYSIALAAGMQHDADAFVVDGQAARSIHIDASAMTFLTDVLGSSGDDVMIGGSGLNLFEGYGGRDIFTGGTGQNIYTFIAQPMTVGQPIPTLSPTLTTKLTRSISPTSTPIRRRLDIRSSIWEPRPTISAT